MVRSTKRPTTLSPQQADALVRELYGYSDREDMDQAQPLPRYAFASAMRLVDGKTPGGVDIAAMLLAWRETDSERRGKGGRPSYVSLRAILILRLAHAIANRPQTVRLMNDTMVMTFTSEDMAALGIVDDDADASVWYQRLTSANSMLVRTLDPSVFPDYSGRAIDLPPASERLNRHRRLTTEMSAELASFRESQSELIAEKQERLDDFLFELNANVIRMAQSVGILEGFDGAVALDATYVAVHGKATFADRSRAGATTAEAGLWVRGGNHGATPGAGTTIKKSKFGFEADLVTMTRGDSFHLPEFILAVDVHKPGEIKRVAETLFSRIAKLGLPKGDCSVDRAYNNLNPEHFAEVMYKHGYELVMDYPKDELGQKESVVIKGTGYIMVDGTWYLASMETGLITCTNDHLNRDPSDDLWIDEEEMLERIASRRAYQLHRHGRRDTAGYQRYLLPDDYISYDPVTGEVQSHAKPTNKTVTIPMSLGARWGQKYPYKSTEWQKAYNLRSTIERKNRELKHNNFLDLESADRRPQRGYGANAVAIAVLVTAGNLVTLDNFLRTGEGIDTTKSPRRRKTKRIEKGIVGTAKQRDGRSARHRMPKVA